MQENEKKTTFMELRSINVNDHVEKKKTGEKNRDGSDKELTYLSWAWAWDEFKQVFPEATYEIKKNPAGLPYFFDPQTGYMVYTTITAGGMTYEMWLPVMDSKNKAMKAEPYQYKTKYETKTVDTATMFDVNKTIMRCLVKNMAMFGLGLYIYAGEDLPDDVDADDKPKASKATKKDEPKPTVETTQTPTQPTAKTTEELAKELDLPELPTDRQELYDCLTAIGTDLNKVAIAYKYKNIDEVPIDKLQQALVRKLASKRKGANA